MTAAPLLRIDKPGLQTTVQDLGRRNYQQYGMPVAGAMDIFALSVANLLAGNEAGAAALEITLIGPEITVLAATFAAIAGADLAATVDGESWPPWSSRILSEGNVVRFGRRVYGARAYLAVGGGIQTPIVLGSRSTFLRGALGGLSGRVVAAGDIINGETHGAAGAPAERRRIAPSALPEYAIRAGRDGATTVIRAIPGPHAHLFSPTAQRAFYEETYTVSPQSDRMGYRLDGPPIDPTSAGELPSEGTAFGDIQIPAGGQPIVMMADRPTTGGYAKIATVATVDLPLVAQSIPGDHLQFRKIEIEEAQRLLRAREHILKQIAIACRVEP